MNNEPKIKEYITTTLCLFGFHNLGKRENKSAFVDNGGWSFGWIARWGRKCHWCGRYTYTRPYLKSDRDRMIKEANK